VRIAIDDFGSGYSNYTHIFEIKPDYLKIDGSLIKNIDQDNNSYELVKSITQLAKSLGIETIAEFVSTREIFEICFDLGVDYFQGYYFAEPCKKECVSQYQKELEAVTG
jgi:EAL domain-containing protein (putative c-di-GMP-specific phosphodiesterase class I)